MLADLQAARVYLCAPNENGAALVDDLRETAPGGDARSENENENSRRPGTLQCKAWPPPVSRLRVKVLQIKSKFFLFASERLSWRDWGQASLARFKAGKVSSSLGLCVCCSDGASNEIRIFPTSEDGREQWKSLAGLPVFCVSTLARPAEDEPTFSCYEPRRRVLFARPEPGRRRNLAQLSRSLSLRTSNVRRV